MSKPILKQDYELSAADFLASPVWVNVHGIDEEKPWYRRCDETTCRPWRAGLPVDPNSSLFVIAAEMTFADGEQVPGAIYGVPGNSQCELNMDSMMGDLQPRIFVHDQSFSFWGGSRGIANEERQKLFRLLRKTSKDVFPIRFSAQVGCAEGITSGIIEGFYRLVRQGENDKGFVVVEQSSETSIPDLSPELSANRPPSPFSLAAERRFDEALQLADKLIAADPKNSTLWSNRAAINRWKGDSASAAADALRSVECEPENGELYPWLCRLLNEAEMFSDCIHYANRGLTARFDEPRVVDYLRGQITFHLARALFETGKPKEAVALLETFPPGYGISGAPIEDRMAQKSYLMRACKAKIRQLSKDTLRGGRRRKT